MANEKLIKATYKLGNEEIILTELPIKSESQDTIVIGGYPKPIEGSNLHIIQPKNSYVKVENLNKPYAYGATKENFICWIRPEDKEETVELLKQMVIDVMDAKIKKLQTAINKIKEI